MTTPPREPEDRSAETGSTLPAPFGRRKAIPPDGSDPTVTETPCLLLASGGVDSCAAAVLLRREGYLPTLVTLLLLPGDTPEGPGPGRARRAAE